MPKRKKRRRRPRGIAGGAVGVAAVPPASSRDPAEPPALLWSRPGLLEPRPTEQPMAQLARLLRDREFATLDEANAFVQQVLAGSQPVQVPPTTPLEAAQDVAYEAWEAKGRRRVTLARRALAVSGDCADAHTILALEAASPEAALGHFRDAVAAGERALGPDAFRAYAGHFWGAVETRPYMRARLGLARALAAAGDLDAAAEHYAELLRLNPGDNQGVRYLLLYLLLRLGRDGEADRLLRRHRDEPSAHWLWGRVLLAWRRRGDAPTTRAALEAALAANPAVPAYLLDLEPVPDPLPDQVAPGSAEEAAVCAADSLAAWQASPGALGWLAAQLEDALQAEEAAATVEEQLTSASADPQVARALLEHREFHPVWDRLQALGDRKVLVGEANPRVHVLVHAAVASQAASAGPPEVALALEALTAAGAGRHEAEHVVGAVLMNELYRAARAGGPFDTAAYAARLRFVAWLTREWAAGRALPPKPRGGAPCPCSSGRRARDCCGGLWPPLPIIPALPHPLPEAPEAALRPRPGITLILGAGRYASPGYLECMPQDAPVVVLENLAAVADALARAGDPEGAFRAHQRIVAEAEAAGDPGFVRNALQDLVDFCLTERGYEAEGVRAAHRAAGLAGGPAEAALYRLDAAELLARQGKARRAEALFREALNAVPRDPWIRLRWARYLEDGGRLDEAEAAYRAVLDLEGATSPDAADAPGAGAPDAATPYAADAFKEARRALRELRRKRR